MKLSVIVPVYNVEAYITVCLDSLLKQDLSDSDYEIICVDDSSTDRSGEIVQEYALRYRQITVIHQVNRGLSAARNAGLQAATGEYVYFIDSDDFLESGVLGGLYCLAAEKNLDQLLFDFESFADEAVGLPAGRKVDPERLILFWDPQEMRHYKAVPKWRTAWNYLVRRSVLMEYGLAFPEGTLFEDAEFNFWLDRCVASCGYLDQKLYYYRRREGSILNTFMTDGCFPQYIQGRLGLAVRHQTILRDYNAGNSPKLRVPVTEAELEDRLIDEVQGILNRLLAKGDRALLQQIVGDLQALGLYPYPLRWRRLVRRVSVQKRVIDVISFFFPLRWYYQLCILIRTRLSGNPEKEKSKKAED